ncbi:DUF4190 domain-containing protein [Demequina capsici]|uniref:DUF4190 domain-containing protein n=1 Tax=Demequina capsici TaxID=3075620 RepID=A0AA96J714_9MICO|nr:DUF4190 domain-containing protein [Demequina sp. OYTSA14]WNM23563.1 DUF4190 domain-containing protein [Demequina sp. OYTSA14]
MSTTPQDPYEQRPDQANPPQAAPTPPAQPPYAQPPAPQYAQPQQGQPVYAQPPTPQYAQPQHPQPPYPQQPYAQPYAPAPYGPQSGTEKNWMGITSLVLSLVGLFTGITAIAGIVFGHLSLSAVKRGEANNRGLGLTGLIIGYVVAVLGILATIAFLVFIGWIGTQCGGDNPASWCTPDSSYSWSA